MFEKTIEFVKQKLKNAEGGHDWWHVYRVWKTAQKIGKEENADMLVVNYASLLHDIADSKFHGGDESLGPKLAERHMVELNLDREVIDHVVRIIQNMSFKNSLGQVQFDSLELRVVQDADRLDAIGAVGIARCFNFGGFKNNPIHSPEIPPKLNMTKEEYKKSEGTSVNHFYEKLLLLKDKMNTNSGKKIAEQRHAFIEQYLDQFFNEFEGKR